PAIARVGGGPASSRAPRGTLKEIISEATDELERQVIVSTLNEHKWNKSRTSRQLGISRPTLDQKIDKFGLKRPAKRRKGG
ncbi:MAG: helix-turn-helix domain-containing protein, partial [Planctomycetota bacterium]